MFEVEAVPAEGVSRGALIASSYHPTYLYRFPLSLSGDRIRSAFAQRLSHSTTLKSILATLTPIVQTEISPSFKFVVLAGNLI